MILELVERGPLIWPKIEENKVYQLKSIHLSIITELPRIYGKEFNFLCKGRPNSYATGTSKTRVNTLGIRRNYSGQQRIVKCFNCQKEGHMARQCPKPKRKRDATWFRDKVLLVEAQGNGRMLNEEELEFLADLGIAEAKVVHMTNLSSYGSYVLSEVPYSHNTNNDMLNQSVQEMPYSEPSQFVEHPDCKMLDIITQSMI
ncbi:integrase, catalytic region, zinc finger, CCHC-type containing protein [Tanacetum coccineum]